jgi:hypothetical protein
MNKLWDIIWEGNIPRQYIIEKVFSCEGSGDGLEIILYGTVTMNLSKENVTLDWEGHMTLAEVNDDLRIKDYYIYGIYPLSNELTSGKQRIDGSDGTIITFKLEFVPNSQLSDSLQSKLNHTHWRTSG